VLGVDAATASSWDGMSRSYGYDPDFVGHAQILMVWDGAYWQAVSYADWDDGARTIDYDWVDGPYAY
jgi:hypothetical protein